MTELRTLLVCALLIVAAPWTAAAENKSFLFRNGPAMGTIGTLPLMAWGPGSMMATPAVMGRLFPPTLIMQRQDELALTEQQEEKIKAELRKFQSQVVDVQWDLQSSQGALESVLEQDRIDADAAQGAIDRVLTAENALKKLHLTLLIEIRNTLNPEQIAKLEDQFTFHWDWDAATPATVPPPAPPPRP